MAIYREDRILARPRTNRFDYYVYGSALSGVSSSESAGGGSSGGGGGSSSSSGEYVEKEGDDLNGAYNMYAADGASLNLEQDVPINFITGSSDEDADDTINAYMKYIGNNNLQFSGLNLVPAITNTRDLGTNTFDWRNLYIRNIAANQVGEVKVANHWLPNEDETYDLGSEDFRWRNLYLSGALISETTYWGQKVDEETGQVYGPLLRANGLYPETDDSFDIGQPNFRYRYGYFHSLYSGAQGNGPNDGNQFQAIQIAGNQTSMYCFGNPNAAPGVDNRFGLLISSRTLAQIDPDTNQPYVNQIFNAHKDMWHMTSRLYVGVPSGSGYYSTQWDFMNNNGIRFYCNSVGVGGSGIKFYQTAGASDTETSRLYEDVSGRLYVPNNFRVGGLLLANGGIQGDLTGNASTATSATSATTASRWANARTITFTGAATGSVSIDGSQNVTCNLTAPAARSINNEDQIQSLSARIEELEKQINELKK